MKRILNKVSNFFKNLKVIIKVHKGALIKMLAVVLIPVTIGLAAFSAPAGVIVVSLVVMVLSILVWIVEDYKEAVKVSAKKEIKASNRKAFKKRKSAAKKSASAQNKEAEATRIDHKFGE